MTTNNKKQPDTCRNVCFTWNNYTEQEYFKVIDDWKCKYLVVAKETGESGTPHLQGYVEWNSSKKFSVMKSLGKGIHWEARKGTAQQAADYCKKTGVFFESGEISQQGKRSDLDDVKTLIDSGASMKEVADEHFGAYIRYNKAFDRYKGLSETDRTEPGEYVWRWGLGGTGKTRFCYENHKTFIKDGTKWWDGYNQLDYDAICIDDFDGVWPFRDFIRLLDRYPYAGQYKGGYLKVNSPYIYITCEFEPTKFWDDNALYQVCRRFKTITHVTKEGETSISGEEYWNNYIASKKNNFFDNLTLSLPTKIN